MDPEPDAVAAPAAEPATRGRSVAIGAAVGLGVGLLCVAVAFSIVAIPMYALASFEPGQGTDRSIVRTGLLQVALPFGAIAGLLTGVVVGVWYARGGRLPTDKTPLHQ